MNFDALILCSFPSVQVVGQQHGILIRTQHQRGCLTGIEVRICRIVILDLLDGELQFRGVCRAAFEFCEDRLWDTNVFDQLKQMQYIGLGQ